MSAIDFHINVVIISYYTSDTLSHGISQIWIKIRVNNMSIAHVFL